MSRDFRSHFRSFAAYNGWANSRLYAAAGHLPEAEYMKPRAAFFKSIHGTLNHLLVADRMWLGRLEHRDPGITALNQILYADLAGLRVARQAEDARITAFVERQSESDLQGTITYKNSTGKAFTTPLTQVLGHLFNHQTHHRGQVSDLLMQTSVAPPELDLIYYLREVG